MVKILLNAMNLRLFSNPFRIKLMQRCESIDSHDRPSSSSTASATTPAPAVNANVPGLSAAVLKIPDGEVGPGAAKTAEYKNPEYFSYNPMSYFEAEIEMLKFRCPQPSSQAKK